MASSNKVSSSDCDNDRQPEILISLELWQIRWQFQRQIWGFWPRPARGNWPQAIATTTDNRKWQYSGCGRQPCNFLVVNRCRNHLAIFYQSGHHRKSRIWRWNFDAICQSSRGVIISGFGGHIDTSGCRSLLYFLRTLFSTYTWFWAPNCRWNFNYSSRSFRDMSISGFGHHFRLSVNFESPSYTSCDFAMVECRRSVVGILMICVIVSEILLYTSG